MKRIVVGTLLLTVMGTSVARADWIDPPDRPWKIQAKFSFPWAYFYMRNASEGVTYKMTPLLVPSVTFGWKFLRIGVSKKLSINDPSTDLSSFRLGLNKKYFVVDFAIQKIKGLRTSLTDGNSHRTDIGYLRTGFNAYGGISFTGDVPYSVQSYYGSVEIPKDIEVDATAFANLNWNSLSADSPIVPAEKAAGFGEVAQLKGFRSLGLNTGLGVGLTFPLGGKWMASTMALAGLSFLTGSHVYTTDNDYTSDIGSQLGLRASVLYRRKNQTWSFEGYFDRLNQEFKDTDFRQDFIGTSVAYSYRF